MTSRFPAAVALVLAVVSAAPAQDLEDVPLEIETLGLSIRLPRDCQVQPERSGSDISLLVTDDPQSPTWQARIQQLRSTLEEPTARAQIEDHLRRLRDTDQPFEVIANERFSTQDAEGQICWLAVDADDGRRVATGWLIVQTAPRVFLVMSAQTLAADLPTVRPLIEASFATASIRQMEAVGEAQRQRLIAGQDFLEAITPDTLRRLVGMREWFRVYRPADPGAGIADREMGYTLVEVLAEQRGRLEPARQETQYSEDQREEGLFLRIQNRLVFDSGGNDVYDTIALYWLSWDGQREAWSIRSTRRQGAAQQTEGETGIRTAPGSEPAFPSGRLTVVRSDASRYTREPFEWGVPEVYLPQPLGWLLGRLIVVAAAEPGEMSWYAYNFAADPPRLSLRRDTWTAAGDGSGNWLLTTRLGTSEAPYVSTYGPTGRLVRRVWNDGTVTEPTTQEEIRRVWR